MNTRFSPTIDSGPLHIGHVLNLFVNFWLARHSGGTMHVVIDNCQVDFRYRQLDTDLYRANMAILGALIPGVNVMHYFANNDQLILHLLRQKIGGQRVDAMPLYGEHAYLIALDFLLGVNALVRGEDWHTEAVNQISAYNLSLLWQRRIPVYYHPVLRLDGEKLSKSHCPEDVTLDHLLNKRRVTPIALLLYVVRLIESEDCSVSDALDYADRFDAASLNGKILTYDPSKLERAHETVLAEGNPHDLDARYTELFTPRHQSDRMDATILLAGL